MQLSCPAPPVRQAPLRQPSAASHLLSSPASHRLSLEHPPRQVWSAPAQQSPIWALSRLSQAPGRQQQQQQNPQDTCCLRSPGR